MDAADITDRVILLKPTKLYRPGMSAVHLYDITRGVWRVDEQKARRASLAFTVIDGNVVEVYTIDDWHNANTTPYRSGRQDQALPKYVTRFEFTGRVVPPGDVRRKYCGLPVGHLFGNGAVVAYINIP
jgi:hypothetical protein